ncbi:MAG TPA: VIT domain-containing protein, partial [Bacteroidota bacterium]|nr:VIT domain-containing protein [Bacteroidota bacterium]
MKTTLLALCLVAMTLFAGNVFGSDFLRVQDPQSWWKGGQGTIEKAVLTVRPAGIYMEYGLYLTFSARGLEYTHSDTFEVQFEFDLPPNSVVYDSWLWIGDTIIRGELLDKWTAESIYEEIVNRRRDPSILYKRTQTHYEMRVFPMAGDESRKVKISYLVPTQWNSRSVLAQLPANLIRTSRNQVSGLSVVTWPDDEWKNPAIAELDSLAFSSASDSVLGSHLRADILWDDLGGTLNFSLDAPFANGLYVNHTGVGSGGYYQLALLPSAALNLTVSRKVAVLFDYDASKSTITPSEVINSVRSALFTTLTTRDSFNVILSQVNIKRASEKWLPSDSATIDSVFSTLGPNPLASYSNLPALLANGVGFISGNGNDGGILLLSNSDQVGASVPANQLIEDLMGLMTETIPVTVVDYQTTNFTYNYIGGRYYYGNEYFYTNITRLTGGNYYTLRTGGTYGPYLNLSSVVPTA